MKKVIFTLLTVILWSVSLNAQQTGRFFFPVTYQEAYGQQVALDEKEDPAQKGYSIEAVQKTATREFNCHIDLKFAGSKVVFEHAAFSDAYTGTYVIKNVMHGKTSKKAVVSTVKNKTGKGMVIVIFISKPDKLYIFNTAEQMATLLGRNIGSNCLVMHTQELNE